jgi:hypothetical protein
MIQPTRGAYVRRWKRALRAAQTRLYLGKLFLNLACFGVEIRLLRTQALLFVFKLPDYLSAGLVAIWRAHSRLS